MEIQKIGGYDIFEIIAAPEKFPEEIIPVAYDALLKVNSQIYEAKKRLEGFLITRMEVDGASKMPFRDTAGQDHVITLKPGMMKCEVKNADDMIKDKGFNPLSIGKYEYKPSWGMAKEARKLGGGIKELIDKIFVPGKASLKID